MRGEPPPKRSSECHCDHARGTRWQPWEYLFAHRCVRAWEDHAVSQRLLRRRYNGENESVTPARQGFDIARRVGRIGQGRAKLGDSHIHGVVEVAKGIAWPDALLQFLARDNRTGLLQQRRQDLQRLVLKPDACSSFAQLARTQIEFEDPKSDRGIRSWLFHLAP